MGGLVSASTLARVTHTTDTVTTHIIGTDTIRTTGGGHTTGTGTIHTIGIITIGITAIIIGITAIIIVIGDMSVTTGH
jgi:hypothetical protein